MLLGIFAMALPSRSPFSPLMGTIASNYSVTGDHGDVNNCGSLKVLRSFAHWTPIASEVVH